jgi:hypothetical protein
MAAPSDITLVGLDIQGKWNLPLLDNAASMSGAAFQEASSRATAVESPEKAVANGPPVPLWDEISMNYDVVVACELARGSNSVYETPLPRGAVAVVVGNEWAGIPRMILNSADRIVNIPIETKRISSLNVAAAAAIVLWVLERDIPRRGLARCGISLKNTDVLLQAPRDPSELGSLLRSLWACGWNHVYLNDPAGTWFTRDPEAVLAGRAAARRSRNQLAVIPANKLDFRLYDRIITCNGEQRGIPLSKLRIEKARRILVEFGTGAPADVSGDSRVECVYVDRADMGIQPRYRHEGSILYSFISQCLTRWGNRG